jgi:hypothetical protein
LLFQLLFYVDATINKNIIQDAVRDEEENDIHMRDHGELHKVFLLQNDITLFTTFTKEE